MRGLRAHKGKEGVGDKGKGGGGWGDEVKVGRSVLKQSRLPQFLLLLLHALRMPSPFLRRLPYPPVLGGSEAPPLS